MATIVAVVDTGLNLQHQDLAPKLWRNQREIAGNGRDDDGNGFVDDIHGIDLITGQALASDPNGHGTHCAGIVVTTEPGVELMGIRVMDARGNGSFSDTLTAWSYALSNGARVISNSFGGAVDPRGLPALQEAVEIGQRRFGAVFVAAAGNEATNTDQVPHSPSGLDGVLSVGASDNGGQRASFSNFGARSVDLFAPGVSILSADAFSNTGRVRFSGTSMATPMVAGAVARSVNRDPASSAEKLKASVLNSVVRRGSLQGQAVTGGVLANEFTQPFTPPLQAQSGGGATAAAFSRPTGGSSTPGSLKTNSNALPGKVICVLRDNISRKQVGAAIGSNRDTVKLEWPEAFDNRICILTYTPGLDGSTVLRAMKSTFLFKSVQEDFQIQTTALPGSAPSSEVRSGEEPLLSAGGSQAGDEVFAVAGLQQPAWTAGGAGGPLDASLGVPF